VKLFACDVCSAEYSTSYGAQACERNHSKNTCPHTETLIATTASDEAVYFNKRCKRCKTTIATREISEYMGEGDNQRIWDALEKLDWPHQEVIDSYAARYGCTGIHLMVKIIQENQLLGKAIATLPQSYRDDITDFLGEKHGKDTVQPKGPQSPTPVA
jgi:hypothetical protein